jgi:hypothetical protein
VKKKRSAATEPLMVGGRTQAATADVPLSYGLYASPLPGAGAALAPLTTPPASRPAASMRPGLSALE